MMPTDPLPWRLYDAFRILQGLRDTTLPALILRFHGREPDVALRRGP